MTQSMRQFSNVGIVHEHEAAKTIVIEPEQPDPPSSSISNEKHHQINVAFIFYSVAKSHIFGL